MERRSFFRTGLHPVYLPYYDGLCGILSSDWQPICGVRSPDKQALLYAIGRTVPGEIVTQAKPGLSFHNYGLASDWSYFSGGKYTPLDRDDPEWQEYLDACEKVGVRCINWEKPHNEYPLKIAIQTVLEVFTREGAAAAAALIERN